MSGTYHTLLLQIVFAPNQNKIFVFAGLNNELVVPCQTTAPQSQLPQNLPVGAAAAVAAPLAVVARNSEFPIIYLEKIRISSRKIY